MNRSRWSFLAAIVVVLLTVGVVAAQAPRAMLPNDLVINSSFEPDASYWNVKNAVGDKVKCGDFGHITDCGFMFVGGDGENTTITQTYTPASIVDPGSQYISFNVNVRTIKGVTKIKFFVKVVFKSGAPKLKKASTFTNTGPMENFTAVEFDTNLFNPADVKKVVIGATNTSTRGKAVVDDFTVGAYE